jgi:hypothetical protein
MLSPPNSRTDAGTGAAEATRADICRARVKPHCNTTAGYLFFSLRLAAQ